MLLRLLCSCCSALAGALPAALSRVAPNLLNSTAAAAQRAGSSSGTSRQTNPALAALRTQLGLPAVPQQPPVVTMTGASASAIAVAGSAAAPAAAAAPCMAPGVVLQELARLGQQLLGDEGSAGGSTDGGSFTSSSSIPPDVLVSAARQHLMSSAVAQLHVAQVRALDRNSICWTTRCFSCMELSFALVIATASSTVCGFGFYASSCAAF
jgi:hypothetical protein